MPEVQGKGLVTAPSCRKATMRQGRGARPIRPIRPIKPGRSESKIKETGVCAPQSLFLRAFLLFAKRGFHRAANVGE